MSPASTVEQHLALHLLHAAVLVAYLNGKLLLALGKIAGGHGKILCGQDIADHIGGYNFGDIRLLQRLIPGLLEGFPLGIQLLLPGGQLTPRAFQLAGYLAFSGCQLRLGRLSLGQLSSQLGYRGLQRSNLPIHGFQPAFRLGKLLAQGRKRRLELRKLLRFLLGQRIFPSLQLGELLFHRPNLRPQRLCALRQRFPLGGQGFQPALGLGQRVIKLLYALSKLLLLAFKLLLLLVDLTIARLDGGLCLIQLFPPLPPARYPPQSEYAYSAHQSYPG